MVEVRATEKGFYNGTLRVPGETFEAHESFSGSWAERVDPAETKEPATQPEPIEVEPAEKPKRGRPKKKAAGAE